MARDATVRAGTQAWSSRDSNDCRLPATRRVATPADRFRWHRQVLDGSQQQEIAMLMEVGSREKTPTLTAACDSLVRNRMRVGIRKEIGFVMLVGVAATWMFVKNVRRRKRRCPQRPRC